MEQQWQISWTWVNFLGTTWPDLLTENGAFRQGRTCRRKTAHFDKAGPAEGKRRVSTGPGCRRKTAPFDRAGPVDGKPRVSTGPDLSSENGAFRQGRTCRRKTARFDRVKIPHRALFLTWFNFNSNMDKQFHPALYWATDYIFMLGLHLYASKRDPWCRGNARSMHEQAWDWWHMHVVVLYASGLRHIEFANIQFKFESIHCSAV